MKGTYVEVVDRLSALESNCACEFGPGHVRFTTCSAHGLLVSDQGVQLVLVRRIARCPRVEEELPITSTGSAQ